MSVYWQSLNVFSASLTQDSHTYRLGWISSFSPNVRLPRASRLPLTGIYTLFTQKRYAPSNSPSPSTMMKREARLLPLPVFHSS